MHLAAESQPNDMCANLDVPEFCAMTAFVIHPTLPFYKGSCSAFSADLLLIHYMLLKLDLFHVCSN